MNERPDFSNESALPSPDGEIEPPKRRFLFESGWRLGIKRGSTREFCYMMAPGQNFYHRLLDGEIYFAREDERICFACASRRGLITFEPKQLRDSLAAVAADLEAVPLELDWRDAKRTNR